MTEAIKESLERIPKISEPGWFPWMAFLSMLDCCSLGGDGGFQVLEVSKALKAFLKRNSEVCKIA